MTNSISYATFKNAGDLPVLRQKVTIKGGAGLPSTTGGFGEVSKDAEGAPMWTPSGMVTPISDAQYDAIKDHAVFKRHVEKGFIKVLNKDISDSHKEVQKQVQTMQQRDGFAQLNKDTIGQHTKVKISQNSIDADVQFSQ